MLYQREPTLDGNHAHKGVILDDFCKVCSRKWRESAIVDA